ncbi:hypothetical protein [Persicirhabdus sediminis]|uniref:Uncharacterized protein n=1 Tax=Persicirhabdus sediminis TaxID=454144 RepID=A0A8J7MBX7_9BACT|nr:hypothetical protein [Persicirhabdus sediminis]MBK1789620.1 hypothetical protein [Persicirhabdus sediminis]
MKLEIEIPYDQKVFVPGEVISGRCVWQLDKIPDSLQLSLLWLAKGRDRNDTELVATEYLKASASGEQTFSFELPSQPLSFRGNLLRLGWMLELVSDGGKFCRYEFELSATGEPLILKKADVAGRKKPWFRMKSR